MPTSRKPDMTGAGYCTGESLQLFYYPEDNMLYDEGGYPVFNVYQYFSPDVWQFFKRYRNYLCIKAKEGYFIELFYVENEQL